MDTKKAPAVWDLPTRIFHWLIAGLFFFSWWCVKTSHMDWHYLSGLTVLALLVFRLIWGFIGGSTARFANFIRGPKAVIAYLRGTSPEAAGHSPLGGYAVLALIGLLLAQVSAGLFAVDTDGLESGPLSHFVSFDSGRSAAGIHGLIFNLLLAMVAIHLLAIAFYRFARKRHLIKPMITGSDPELAADAPSLVKAAAWRLIIAVIIAGGIAIWVAKGAPL